MERHGGYRRTRAKGPQGQAQFLYLVDLKPYRETKILSTLEDFPKIQVNFPVGSLSPLPQPSKVIGTSVLPHMESCACSTRGPLGHGVMAVSLQPQGWDLPQHPS